MVSARLETGIDPCSRDLCMLKQPSTVHDQGPMGKQELQIAFSKT